MGIIDPLLAEDIDCLADELLKRLDPDPLELLARALTGSASTSNDDDVAVYVDGIRR